MGMQDTIGARKHVLPCQTQKPVPLLVSTLDMKPLRFWENLRRIAFLSKLSTFLTWDLGTWTKNPVWDLPSICQETNSGGRSKVPSAMPPTLVFHLSVSHRQPLKLNAGWNSLVRLANARFKKQKKKYSLISRLSSDMIILKICLPTVQLRSSECLTKPLLISIVYDFYDALVLQ